MSLDAATLLAVLAMALVTYATRIGGWLAVRRIALPARARAALEAVPGAVLASVIAPMALATGPAETAAAAVTLLAATRLPALACVGIGVASVIAFRAGFG